MQLTKHQLKIHHTEPGTSHITSYKMHATCCEQRECYLPRLATDVTSHFNQHNNRLQRVNLTHYQPVRTLLTLSLLLSATLQLEGGGGASVFTDYLSHAIL